MKFYVFSIVRSEGFNFDSVSSDGRNRLKYHAQKVDINANSISTFENPQYSHLALNGSILYKLEYINPPIALPPASIQEGTAKSAPKYFSGTRSAISFR